MKEKRYNQARKLCRLSLWGLWGTQTKSKNICLSTMGTCQIWGVTPPNYAYHLLWSYSICLIKTSRILQKLKYQSQDMRIWFLLSCSISWRPPSHTEIWGSKMSAAGGYIAAVGSAICNGSFGSISKIRKVQDAKVSHSAFSLQDATLYYEMFTISNYCCKFVLFQLNAMNYPHASLMAEKAWLEYQPWRFPSSNCKRFLS